MRAGEGASSFLPAVRISDFVARLPLQTLDRRSVANPRALENRARDASSTHGAHNGNDRRRKEAQCSQS